MIRFDADTVQVDQLSRYAASLSLSIEAITSHALNSALKGTHEAMRSQLPQRIDRPTPWTTRGLLRRSSTPQDLTAAVGFNYGDGEFIVQKYINQKMGTPSGRYMDVQARGGARSPKSTELRLRRNGLLSGDQFLVPTGKGPSTPDRYGNVRAGVYTQMMAGIRAASYPGLGYEANTPRSRSTSGRYWVPMYEEADYWSVRLRSIAVRSGARPQGKTGKGSGRAGRPASSRLPRSLTYVFNVTKAPMYSPRFPLRSLAMREFERLYPDAFRRAIESARSRR